MTKVLIFLFLFVSALSLGQQNEKQITNKISQIQKKLLELKGKLNKSYGQEKIIIEQLEQQDQQINRVAKNITSSKQQLLTIGAELQQINEKIQEKTKSIETQKNQVVDLLKMQVYLNHNKTLKMLLLSPNNKISNQTKHQIKYLQNKLYNLIKEVAVEIKQLKLLKTDQEQLESDENIKQQTLLSQQDELFEKRKQRLNILNQLKSLISKHETESEGLNKDQKRLAQLLLEIKNILSDLPSDLGSNKPFKLQKGTLQIPVLGKYIRSFRSRRSEDTKWNGVVIKAGFGESVKSIAYGRIAYADWLRGFGMLVIIDHQGGYMSLYGFNESINVEVGDWVNPQQVIATIGNSGTLATAALYFEIRKDAKPLNPKKWVK